MSTTTTVHCDGCAVVMDAGPVVFGQEATRIEVDGAIKIGLTTADTRAVLVIDRGDWCAECKRTLFGRILERATRAYDKACPLAPAPETTFGRNVCDPPGVLNGAPCPHCAAGVEALTGGACNGAPTDREATTAPRRRATWRMTTEAYDQLMGAIGAHARLTREGHAPSKMQLAEEWGLTREGIRIDEVEVDEKDKCGSGAITFHLSVEKTAAPGPVVAAFVKVDGGEIELELQRDMMSGGALVTNIEVVGLGEMPCGIDEAVGVPDMCPAQQGTGKTALACVERAGHAGKHRALDLEARVVTW